MNVPATIRMAALTAALVLPIAALARAPYTPAGADAALLRLSWRLSAPAQERCRTRTAEELAALPAHMRTPEVCERHVARYLLVTRVGDAAPDTLALQGGGAKGDRPLFVLEERKLLPGRHAVHVALLRQTDGGSREEVAALDTVLFLRPGRVALITMEGEDHRLVARQE